VIFACLTAAPDGSRRVPVTVGGPPGPAQVRQREKHNGEIVLDRISCTSYTFGVGHFALTPWGRMLTLLFGHFDEITFL